MLLQSDSGILLTTYDQLRLQRGSLLAVEWGYVVLDEGHKIRNPDAEITLVRWPAIVRVQRPAPPAARLLRCTVAKRP